MIESHQLWGKTLREVLFLTDIEIPLETKELALELILSEDEGLNLIGKGILNSDSNNYKNKQ